jgi:hypothetical protein
MSFKLEKTNQAFCEEFRAEAFEQVLVKTADNSYGVEVESTITAVWNTWGMSFVVKAHCVSMLIRFHKYYEKHFETYEEARSFDLDLPLIFKEFLYDNCLDKYQYRKNKNK